MLGDFQDEPGLTAGHLQGVEDGREALVELYVDDGTDDGHDAPVGDGSCGGRCDIVSACEPKRGRSVRV